MVLARLITVGALVCIALTSTTASANVTEDEETSIRTAKEGLRGSGISSRTLAGPGDARYKFKLATLTMHVTPSLTVKAGAGVAKLFAGPGGVARQEEGIAGQASLSFNFFQSDRLAFDLNLSGARVAYADHTLTDGTVLVAMRVR